MPFDIYSSVNLATSRGKILRDRADRKVVNNFLVCTPACGDLHIRSHALI
ncbi:MAG TPA: hypothetical protein VJY43_04310 [Methanocorpusculum sp.]|nr:hypothetical protein [Methanocorpusculum sp.]